MLKMKFHHKANFKNKYNTKDPYFLKNYVSMSTSI